VTKPGATISNDDRAFAPVFISYATADRTEALKVCEAIERRGTKCWISMRDVAPGANYQEAIVQSLRTARAMVLVFSDAANCSDEIKKELSLASRYHVPVIALRLEDVEPSDAFAYELSTRQWINAFEGWDKSIDALVGRIGQISPVTQEAGLAVQPRTRRRLPPARRRLLWAGALSFLFLAAAGVWFALRLSPSSAEAHSMEVRLAGFQLLSADLPATMRDVVNSEIIAAFNEDGVVSVSTASAPAPGAAPAYALGGTIQRDGHTIRVITRLTNERSGATLWTDNFDYEGSEVSRVPRHIAVDAGNVVRCGLFGVSTYEKPLPDNVLKDYMQFCAGYFDPNTSEGRKALIPAQRVVAAVPDFSWGWAAVAGAYWKVASNSDDSRLAEEARANGRQAADRAIALDNKNSEAMYIKSRLLDQRDWIGRESLLKQAVAARGLDCGCEHHQYGWMLLNVGRITDAVYQLRQANDMLALYVYTPLSLADALVAAGKPEEAKPHFDAAIALAPDAGFAGHLEAHKAAQTGDINLLLEPRLPISKALRGALVKGYRALASDNATAKAQAVQTLIELAEDQQDESVASLLANLGANQEAFRIAARLAAAHEYPGPSVFWYRSMRGTLADPGFPAVAKQLGLMKYWKTTHTKPDACNDKAPPPFCRMI
jgi:tetratricopeptide (TPR) repeat protein